MSSPTTLKLVFVICSPLFPVLALFHVLNYLLCLNSKMWQYSVQSFPERELRLKGLSRETQLECVVLPLLVWSDTCSLLKQMKAN